MMDLEVETMCVLYIPYTSVTLASNDNLRLKRKRQCVHTSLVWHWYQIIMTLENRGSVNIPQWPSWQHTIREACSSRAWRSEPWPCSLAEGAPSNSWTWELAPPVGDVGESIHLSYSIYLYIHPTIHLSIYHRIHLSYFLSFFIYFLSTYQFFGPPFLIQNLSVPKWLVLLFFYTHSSGKIVEHYDVNTYNVTGPDQCGWIGLSLVLEGRVAGRGGLPWALGRGVFGRKPITQSQRRLVPRGLRITWRRDVHTLIYSARLYKPRPFTISPLKGLSMNDYLKSILILHGWYLFCVQNFCIA